MNLKYIAWAISAVAAIVAFVATVREDRENERAKSEALARERLNLKEIILSSQDLKSLTLRWSVTVPPPVIAGVRSAIDKANAIERECRYSPDVLNEEVQDAAMRRTVVFPLLNALATGEWPGSEETVVASFWLDSSAAAVLPIGCVAHHPSGLYPPGPFPPGIWPLFTEPVSEGDDIESQFRQQLAGIAGSGSQPMLMRTSITTAGQSADLEITLSAAGLRLYVQRVAPEYRTLASFPEELQIVLYKNFREDGMPSLTAGFAVPLPYDRLVIPERAKDFQSTLKVIANDDADRTFEYEMVFKGSSHFGSVNYNFGNVAVWHGKRIERARVTSTESRPR